MNWRRMTFAGLLALGFGLAATGCFVVSLSPWFGTGDVVEDKAFEGMWQTDEDEWLEVTPVDVEYGGATVKGYKLRYRECGKDKEDVLLGVVGQVGKERYLAYVSPEDDMDKLQGVPAYLLTRMTIEEDRLSLGHLSRKHLEDLWKKHRLGLSFLCADKSGVRSPARGEAKLCGGDPLVLIEDRAALREFLASNQDDPGLFDQPEKPATRIARPPCGNGEKPR